jgi:hypothetical protein
MMPKGTTRPPRDSRRWRKAAMNNPLCKRSDNGLVLFLLIAMGVLLIALTGSILAFSLPSDSAAASYRTDYAVPNDHQSYSLL